MEVNREVREELLHSLHEWGVSGTHKEHVNFRKKVIENGLKMVSSNGGRDSDICSFKHLKSVPFPETIHEAFHHVLVNDIETVNPESCVHVTDTLGVEGFGEPKFRWLDRRMKVVRYRLKREYQRFNGSELDPLRRYEFKTLPKDEYFFDRWFVGDETESIMGTFLEAWFACHAIKKEACFNCKARNSLRWAGGSGSSWQDLVCISCECMYELKTKASMEKIEKVFHHNNLPSGSFKAYCTIQNSRRENQKMFIVILPRQCAINKRREQYHPVIVSEIKSVRPRLFDGTFNTQTVVRIRSMTTMDLKTKTKWFDLPSVESINLQDSMKKAFAQVFGREAYERCHPKSQIQIDEREDSYEDDSKIGSESESAEEDIADQIGKLTIEEEEVPDNWEDAYDSE